MSTMTTFKRLKHKEVLQNPIFVLGARMFMNMSTMTTLNRLKPKEELHNPILVFCTRSVRILLKLISCNHCVSTSRMYITWPRSYPIHIPNTYICIGQHPHMYWVHAPNTYCCPIHIFLKNVPQYIYIVLPNIYVVSPNIYVVSSKIYEVHPNIHTQYIYDVAQYIAPL